MTISAEKFRDELRRKFGTDVRAVARRLGIDINLLRGKPAGADSNGSGDDQLQEFRAAVEQALDDLVGRVELPAGGIDGFLEVLDRFAPRASAADQDDRFAAVKEFLRNKGMSEDDIMGACDALTSAMPKNGTQNGGGAFSGRHAEDRMRRMAHDSELRERGRADCEQMFPHLAHVGFAHGDQPPESPPPRGTGLSDVARLAERIAIGPF
jgi:hypothetical protein